MSNGFTVNPQIFEALQTQIDEDTAFQDEIRRMVQTLSKDGWWTGSVISRKSFVNASQFETRKE
jgi:hypothetical protein